MSNKTAKRQKTQAGKKEPGGKALRRILRALAQADAILWREAEGDGESGGGGDGAYLLRWKTAQGAPKNMQPAPELVKQCLRRGLLDALPEGEGGAHADGWRLNAAGRMALRRLLAGAEPFAGQHQARRVESRKMQDGARREVVVNDRATPLGWLARRKDKDGRPMISAAQFEAGERLARDFQFAGMTPSVTANWGVGSGGGRGRKYGARKGAAANVEHGDNCLAAGQRVRRALDKVGGDLADILLEVCCFQIGLSEVETRRKWPRRSGKVILQIALDHLAAHYGLNVARPTPPIHQRLTHWGAPNYRPSIDGG